MSSLNRSSFVLALGTLILTIPGRVQAQLCFNLPQDVYPRSCSDANYFVVNADGEVRVDDFSDLDVAPFESSFDGSDLFDPNDPDQARPDSLPDPFFSSGQLDVDFDNQGRIKEFTFRQRGAVTLGARDSESQDASWGNSTGFRFWAATTDESTDDVDIETKFNARFWLSDPSENNDTGGASVSARSKAIWDEQSGVLEITSGIIDLDLEQNPEPRFFGDFAEGGGFEPSTPGRDDEFNVWYESDEIVSVTPEEKLVLELDSFGGAFTKAYEEDRARHWAATGENTFSYTVRSDNPKVRFVIEGYEADDFAINPGLNDAWFNADTAGQGFFIIVFPDRKEIFLSWFTYDTERPPEDVEAILGEPGHRWLTAQGPYEGDTAMLDVYQTEGGVFDMTEPKPTTGEPIGTIKMVWSDCENATLTYDIDPPPVSGTIELTRITLDNVALCGALNE